MEGAPWVALLDEGELDDVRAALEDLGIDFSQWRKGDRLASPPHPEQLLVTTADCAASGAWQRALERNRRRAVWIAVSSGDARARRSAIFGSGFDYLVLRPVPRELLALLLRRALYPGDEERLTRRVAVGYAVSFRAGEGAGRALLIDLSPGGCRLLTRTPLQPGTELEVHFPEGIAGGTSFAQRGSVTRAGSGAVDGGQPGETSLGVRFLPFDAPCRERLLSLLNSLSSGPASLSAAPAEDSTSAAGWRAPRAAHERAVAIFGFHNGVLLGRELSLGGIRVDPHRALRKGAPLRLALHGSGDAPPVVADARVAHDDGESGVALDFEWIEPGGEKRLQAIAAAPPAIETPAGEGRRGGVLLAEIIPRLLRCC